MSDWSEAVLATPTHIHNVCQFSAGGLGRVQIATGAPAAATWVANLAVYTPFHLPWPYVVQRIFWINGSTIGSNVDCGVFSSTGSKIISSGSTAQVGASAVQYVSITPTILQPGAYYFAWACSGTTTAAFATTLAAQEGEMLGLQQQSTALPLPASMTEVAYTGGGMPFCGVTRTSAGF